MSLLMAACSQVHRPADVRERAAPRHIVVLGDSLALGSGATDPALGFAFRLFRQISGGAPGSDVTSHAIGGARVHDVIAGQVPRARGDAATDVWIVVGSNDVTHGTSITAFTNEETRLVRDVKGRWRRARIVVFGIPDIARSPLFVGRVRTDYRHRAAGMNAGAREAARAAGARFVDLYAFSDRVPDFESDLSNDEFHPNDHGHAAIAAFAYPTVR
ncbi:MAG: GDSL-type esterase/lipase family protein [Vulcanimicrobiaceae bacterium]